MILCALACAHADSQRALNHLDRHRLPAAGLDLFPNAGHSGGESVDSRAGCRRGARGTHTAYLCGRGSREERALTAELAAEEGRTQYTYPAMDLRASLFSLTVPWLQFWHMECKAREAIDWRHTYQDITSSCIILIIEMCAASADTKLQRKQNESADSTHRRRCTAAVFDNIRPLGDPLRARSESVPHARKLRLQLHTFPMTSQLRASSPKAAV